MKKKLEADLMSIAHRVLQMKNKSDINQLCIETRKLYEKLAILQFVEEHFEGAKPTIGQAEIVEKMKQFFEETHLSEVMPTMIQDEIVIEEEIIEEEIVTYEVVVDVIEEEIHEVEETHKVEEVEEKKVTPPDFKLNDIGFQPAFELDKEEVEEEEEKSVEDTEPSKPKEAQISFLDLLGNDYSEPMFVKVDQSEEKPSAMSFDIDEDNDSPEEEPISKNSEQKSVSLNDKFSKGINIGLNDRIAFVKHLFGNSDEDYNRVLNQLITYDNFDEAQDFIEDMVKPDYNSWEGKEDYAQRFIEIIEKKFA